MSAREQRGAYTPGEPLNDAIAMAIAPFALGALGWWLDSVLSSGPVLLIAFGIFGVASSFAAAYYRYTGRIAQQESGKPWARAK